MEKIELNKCYLVEKRMSTLLFKVAGFTKRFDSTIGIELFEIYASVGFETNSRLILKSDGFCVPTQGVDFIEIDERELDKLEHAYKCASAIFYASIKKLTPAPL